LFGVVTGLIRRYDWVILDKLAHACLRTGAAAATSNVSMFAHNDLVSLEAQLVRIRSSDSTNAILVVTEGLFSMDSDSPDIRTIRYPGTYRPYFALPSSPWSSAGRPDGIPWQGGDWAAAQGHYRGQSTEMNTKNVETDSATHRYVRLANILRSAVEAGELREHQALPSERDLAEKYDVSRDTVRKAVRLMQEQGVIYSDHGRGNFVAPAMVRGMTRFIDSFSEDTGKRGSAAGQRILEAGQVPATLALGGVLNVPPGQMLTRVHRVRLIDDVAVGTHDAYFALPREAKLTANQIERAGSLYRLLKERFGFAPAEAVENLSATLAGASDAMHLGIEVGAPLLVCERVTLSDRREPIEYCLMKYVQTYRYSTRVVANGRS
jgi:GntR family transcriptional regulator